MKELSILSPIMNLELRRRQVLAKLSDGQLNLQLTELFTLTGTQLRVKGSALKMGVSVSVIR